MIAVKHTLDVLKRARASASDEVENKKEDVKILELKLQRAKTDLAGTQEIFDELTATIAAMEVQKP